jgi:hypothetical protein
MASERLELPVAVGPAPGDDVTSGAASAVGVEDGDDDSGTDGVGADVAVAVGSVDDVVVTGVTDRGSGRADRIVGAALADAGGVVAIACGGVVETVAGTPHLGRGRTLGGSAAGSEITGGHVVLELLGVVSDGAVDGGAVSGTLTSGIDGAGTVDSGTVESGTVESGTVESGTVESGTVESSMQSTAGFASAEETPTGSALPSTTAITSSSTTSHGLRSAVPQSRSTDPRRRPMRPACAGSLVLAMDPGRVRAALPAPSSIRQRIGPIHGGQPAVSRVRPQWAHVVSVRAGHLDAQPGAGAGWAVEVERPAHHVDPVGQAAETRATRGECSADAVVTDVDRQHVGVRLDSDLEP